MSIRDHIQALADDQRQVYSLVGVVKEVDKANRICTVQPSNDPEDKLYGVRLQSAQGLNEGVLVLPKVGSEVVVTFINESTGYVALCGEVDALEISIHGYQLSIDQDGILLANSVVSLGKIWLDLVQTLRAFKLTTNTGVTIAPTPDTMLSLAAIETSIKQLLKQR